jgi:hypothetical protein
VKLARNHEGEHLMPYKSKAKQAAGSRRWYLAHRELVNSRSMDWKRRNPEKRRASDKKYRDRKKINRLHDERMARGSLPIRDCTANADSCKMRP